MSEETQNTDSKGKDVDRTLPRLGELLLAEGLITPDQLRTSLELQNRSNEMLGIVLMRQKLVTEIDVYRQLGKQLNIPFFEDLQERKVSVDILDHLPRDIAVSLNVLPVEQHGETLFVAMENPLDAESLNLLQQSVQVKISPGLATRGDLHFAVNRIYNDLIRANPIIKEFYDGLFLLLEQEEFDPGKVTDLILATAYLINADHIYLKFKQNELDIGFRIEGILHNIPLPRRRFIGEQIAQILMELKAKAGLEENMGNSPSGLIELIIDQKPISAEVSELELVDGSEISLKIRRGFVVRDIDDIGFNRHQKLIIDNELQKSHGLILVCGPLNSGRTTTCAALLKKLSSTFSHIVIIDEEQKIQLQSTSRVKVEPGSKYTASSQFRRAIKHDSDIILLGGQPDREICELTLQATKSGSLVIMKLASLDLSSALTSLLNLGIARYELAAAINSIIVQRLMPMICSNCKTPLFDSEQMAAQLGIMKDTKLFHGTGCAECYYTGRKGRIPVYEVVSVNNECRTFSATAPNVSIFVEQFRKIERTTLYDDAVAKCEAGIISPQDILRLD